VKLWIVGALALAAAGCGPQKAATTALPSAPPVLPADVREVAEANRKASPSPSGEPAGEAGGPLRVSGEFVSTMESEVGARISGRVAQIFADQGQRVRRGQRLLALETEYLDLDVKRAQAELARAHASLQEAEREFARKKELLGKGSVSQAAYDKAQSMHEQAQAARAGADAAVALARQRQADAVVVSPVDGVVVSRRADTGERIGDSTVTFVVAQTSPLKLRFKVPERYLGSIREGEAVHARVDPYPDQVFDGRIAVVGGSVDPGTRTFTVEAEFPNRDDRLKPGLFARVELDTARAEARR
jgi:membrane fusion protein (multidrug efflux system)